MSAELLPADIQPLQPAQPPAVAATPFAAATHPDAVEAMGCLHSIQVAVDPRCPASSAGSSHSAGREVAVAPLRATAVAVPPAQVPSAAQAAFQPAAQAALEEMEALQAAALEVVAPPQLWLLMAVVCRAGMSQQTFSNM